MTGTTLDNSQIASITFTLYVLTTEGEFIFSSSIPNYEYIVSDTALVFTFPEFTSTKDGDPEYYLIYNLEA